jgi:HNH endonuclease/NUMOD3 motif
MMTHIHHIIPKHAGGTDELSNLIELTVADHASAHKLLFEQYGRTQDRLAWQGLSGIIGREEIVQELSRLPKSMAMRERLRLSRLGKTHSEETKRKIGAKKLGVPRGPVSVETRRKLSELNRGGLNITPQCRRAATDYWTGRKQTPEHIKNAAAARVGKHRSLITRLRMSESQRQRRLLENKE